MTLKDKFFQIIGKSWMSLLGWTIDAQLPAEKKYVLVGGPHTSNWDFPLGLATIFALNIKVYWMAKDSLFWPPLGYVMRALGGISIDRKDKHGVVGQMVEKFNSTDDFIVGIAAKGTRKRTPYWKSGFYWIAYNARVPIVCCYLDYERRRACIGYKFIPSGDVRADMEKVRAFYVGVVGKHPEFHDNIRLKEEDA